MMKNIMIFLSKNKRLALPLLQAVFSYLRALEHQATRVC
jgi:hypothetical protein